MMRGVASQQISRTLVASMGSDDVPLNLRQILQSRKKRAPVVVALVLGSSCAGIRPYRDPGN